MRGRAARADTFPGGDAVDGLVVEVGQAGRRPVPQVLAVGVGQQDGDQHFLGRQVLDGAGHALKDVGQGRLAGDLLQQGAVLGRQPLGVLDLGGLHPDDPYAHGVATGVQTGLVGEVEERLPRARTLTQHHPGIPAGVGLAGAVHLVQEGEEALVDEFGQQLAEGHAGAGAPTAADRGEERRVRRLQHVRRLGEGGEHGRRLPEQGPQVILRPAPAVRPDP